MVVATASSAVASSPPSIIDHHQNFTEAIQDTSDNFYEAENRESDEQSSNDDEDDEYIESPIKCSAVHTLERDMPDFDYSHVVQELRRRILLESKSSEGIYSQSDIDKCAQDDWFLSRYLLRQKMDIDLAFDMLKRCMRFRHENLANSLRREDFPAEFYKIGGVFGYEPDRKGNRMLYIRVKVHRKIPEVQAVIQAFLFYNIQLLDEEANGRGISIVFDCSGGGLANADIDILLFFVSTLTNYFPKGLSYLLVHRIPWILKPFWHIAKALIPEEHRQLVKFSDPDTIYEYVDRENLPDFMGGTCKRDYRAAPENCTTLEEAGKLWGVEAKVIKRILLKFADYLPQDSLHRAEEAANQEEKNES